MHNNPYQHRSGATLVELLLYVTLMAMMSSTVLPLLFSSTESRQRQDAIALVEQSGAQIMQQITQSVRDAERVIYPAFGGTGTILVLQTDSEASNPTIFARSSGAIIMVTGTATTTISTTLVGATSFLVDNVSPAADKNAVAVSFNLRRTIRLHQPLVYLGYFEAVLNTFPDDIVTGDSCGCDAPYCDSGSGTLVWQTCQNDVCTTYQDYDCLFGD